MRALKNCGSRGSNTRGPSAGKTLNTISINCKDNKFSQMTPLLGNSFHQEWQLFLSKHRTKFWNELKSLKYLLLAPLPLDLNVNPSLNLTRK